jgi:hypothetical protein
MAVCYRCEVVTTATGFEPVGACVKCNTFACKQDGERDTALGEFWCGECDVSRLSRSAGVPPMGTSPPGPPGGSAPAGPAPGSGPPGPGGGAARVLFASGAEFEERRPTIARESAEHRRLFHDDIEGIIGRLVGLRDDATERELARVDVGLDEQQVAATAQLFGDQLREARSAGALDPELLADALGVAHWWIGADAGREPHLEQLRHVSDPRIRVVLGRYMRIATY